MLETLVGTSLGGYTLTRLIGSGGMGAVYLAEDPTIGQQVAIKVVRSDEGSYFGSSAGPQQVAERFKQEARAIASLDHLHILPLYRYGEERLHDGRRAYMVMQYRPEGSLWDWLHLRMDSAANPSLAKQMPAGLNQGWPLSLEEASDYLSQAASALQYAHDRGIVHRDVKPANFLLRFGSEQAHATVKSVFLLLSDFGLAKLFSSSSATSTIFGTPLYMAPEQFEGAAVPSSDQYALAVMIYLFLAGHPPFEGDPAQLMHKHLDMPPPPIRAYAPNLPGGIESVLARALAKGPSERYPSVAAFAQDFVQRLHEPGSATYRNVPPSQPVYPATNATRYPSRPNAQLFVPSGGPYVLPHNEQTMQELRPIAQSLPMYGTPPQMATQVPGAKKRTSRRAVLGLLVAGLAVIGTGAGVYLYTTLAAPPLAVATPTPTVGNTPTNPTKTATQALYTLTGHTQSVNSVAWSPDGTQLASSSEDHTVRLWSTASRTAQLTYNGHHLGVLSAAWSPSGNLLASGGREKIGQIWNQTGTLQRRFTEQGAITALVWSSETQLFVGVSGDGVYVQTSGAEKKTRLFRGAFHSLALAPGGRLLAFGTEKGLVYLFNIAKGQLSAPHVNHVQPVLSLAWSPNGLQLASGSSDGTAKVMEVATGRIARTLQHGSAVNGLAWQPSGTGSLATASADGIVRIWAANNPTPLLYQGHSAAVNSIAWSSAGLASGSQDTSVIIWNV